MVKSKKMSKTSIAVIVLAILLSLSLVLGMTGAWFTSHYEKNHEFTFGNVTITLDGADWAAVDINNASFASSGLRLGSPEKHIMPGDKIKFEGTVTNSNEAAFVYMTYKAIVDEGGSSAKHDEDLSAKLNVTVSSGWAVLTQGAGHVLTADEATFYNAYKGLEGGAAKNATDTVDDMPVLQGGAIVYYVALDVGSTETPVTQACNFVYNLAGATFGDAYEDLRIDVYVTFEAIQQANVANALEGYGYLPHTYA